MMNIELSLAGGLSDQYRIKQDKASGIVNDPNEWSEDPRYIVELVKRMVRVSMETVKIVAELPDFHLSDIVPGKGTEP
jgi:predicted helicase